MSALTDVVEEDFVIEANDRVFVRLAVDRRTTGEVVLLGEVMRPGQYALLHHEERLSNLITRAGGGDDAGESERTGHEEEWDTYRRRLPQNDVRV